MFFYISNIEVLVVESVNKWKIIKFYIYISGKIGVDESFDKKWIKMWIILNPMLIS